MSVHQAQIEWSRAGEGFSYPEYNRDHEWMFPGGTRISASAAPVYLGTTGKIDPEEAFVAAVASCHMLTFLAICARKGFVVDNYTDAAAGYLEKNPAGRLAITHVELSPTIAFGGTRPSQDEIERLHHLAHEQCFIANSVRTRVSFLRYA